MIRGKKLRAVSPVIAVLLLIIVSVVAGVAVYSFVSGFISQTTAQSKTPSSIVIDAAVLKSGSATYGVNATVRNVGQVDAEIIAVNVLNASDLSLVANDTSPSGTTTLTAGQIGVIKAFSGGVGTGVTKGDWYIIQVITQDGSSATKKVRAH